ncbi:MAG: hypothetical protein APF80_00625 [Alphaproteobacteria bacterium BRH_c36]|nr:MAG: hypothetical protein APF80_00625 [Alphaproteobacteria bacterium BRH_c36]
MSIRSLPLIVFAFIFYNIVVLFGASDTGNAESILRSVFFSLPSFRSGAAEGVDAVRWTFTWGDLIILVTMLLLFVEILKATYTSTASLLDHGLSMLVFIACLVEFLLVDAAYTSVFFLLMVATLIDVIAGYTIGIRVARRDIGFGGMGD